MVYNDIVKSAASISRDDIDIDEIPDRIERVHSTLGTVKELVPLTEIISDINEFTDVPETIENSVQREDRHRELRAMLLSVHPCPPLPQMALGGLNLEDRVFSSHDFLASAIDRMIVKKDAAFDSARRAKQHHLITAHFEELRVICDAVVEESAFPILQTSGVDSKDAVTITVDGVLTPAARVEPSDAAATTKDAVTITVDGVLTPSARVEPSDAAATPVAIVRREVVESRSTGGLVDTMCPEIEKVVEKTLGEVVVAVSLLTTVPLETDTTPDSAAVSMVLPAFDKLKNEKDSNTTAEKLYDCFTRFSRQHAIVYFEENASHKIDIRYKPLGHVCRRDPVHLAACSHLRAYRLMRAIEPTSATEFEDLSYSDVIVAFAKEVVRDDDGVY
jgi:hypothetical protein